jgi:hypothetical protein
MAVKHWHRVVTPREDHHRSRRSIKTLPHGRWGASPTILALGPSTLHPLTQPHGRKRAGLTMCWRGRKDWDSGNN